MMLERKNIGWPDAPTIFAALVLAVGSILLLAQWGLGAVAHGKQMRLCAALIGVMQPDRAAFSMASVLDGQFQASFARRIGTVEPYYPTAVRLRNQVEYSLFGMSAEPDIVVGRHRELIESGYIAEYCSRNITTFETGAPAAAAMLRRVQDAVERRSQVFLYVVTPSKIAQYPEFLPAGMPCLASPASRVGIVPAWTGILRQAGIHFLDTGDVLSDAHADYPFPLFPHGGTHWNQVGAARAAQAVESTLQAQQRDGVFAPFAFTWSIGGAVSQSDTDIDLATLMNLFNVPDKTGLPRVTVTEAPKPASCGADRVVIVGGSFMESIGAMMSQLPCRPRIVEYFYWRRNRVTWSDGTQMIGPVDPGQRDAELTSANVIIVEENESLVARSDHVAAFARWLGAR